MREIESELGMESSRTNCADPEASSSHSNYGEPRPLNLGCRIFISHSGKDKNFVRYLHDKLVDKLYHDDGTVFFDEESFPIAEPISMQNILPKAEACELGVLVLTEDFFTHTRNPMLELQTLTTSKKRLLPLFFKISVEEFKRRRDENVWEAKWKEWLKGDEVTLRKWKDALKFVDGYSGLEHCKLGGKERDYINNIVATVARIVRPAVSCCKEGVYGMDRICKVCFFPYLVKLQGVLGRNQLYRASQRLRDKFLQWRYSKPKLFALGCLHWTVDDMYNQCALKRTSDGCTSVVSIYGSNGRRADSGDSLDLVGIYGFAGLGKSTLCQCLLDFYFPDFQGNVCWLDLGSSVPAGFSQASSLTQSCSPSESRMLHLLKLTGFNIDIVGQPVTLHQIPNLLRKRIRRDPIFLAIDNILPDLESQEEAQFYLDCEFAEGSKIFITSRSGKILEHVLNEYTKFSAVIECIPKLKLEEARGIFEHEIPELAQMSSMEDEVQECVSVCAIRVGDNLFNPHRDKDDDKWYHPLMLKCSAASIRHAKRLNPDLKIRFREFMRSAAAVNNVDAWKRVFDMLDISYAILSDDAKMVFLDLAVFYKVFASNLSRGYSSYAWLKSIHSHRLDKVNLDTILLFLEDLSFIAMKDYNFVMEDYNCHKWLQLDGLMVDFAKYKIMQDNMKPGAAGFKQEFLMLDSGAQLRNPAFSFLLASSSSTSYDRLPSLSALPKSVRTVSISGCRRPADPGAELGQLDLRNLEGVEVLHLVDNPGVQEVLLSRSTIAQLRSFIVHGPVISPAISLRCTIDECWPTLTRPSQTLKGGNLVWVELRGNVIFSTRRKQRDAWAEGALKRFFQRLGSSWSSTDGLGILQPFLRNLQYLKLDFVPAIINIQPFLRNLQYLKLDFVPAIINIDVTTCTNLKTLKVSYMSSLRAIHGLQSSTDLKTLDIANCEELQLLSFPANLMLAAGVRECRRLERISLLTTPVHPEADYTGRLPCLYVSECPALKNVDGIAQLTGECCFDGVAIQGLLESIEAGSHKFKCTVMSFSGYPWHGLAGLETVSVTDVQHVGLLISALVKSQAASRDVVFCHLLYDLTIHCKKDGDCGCDKIEPHFSPGLSSLTSLEYRCSQVRNLASLPLLIGNRLQRLSLRGCGNVEVWPDFTTMTSLESLNLSCTSLKEWPTGVQQLPRLKHLNIEGCWQLSAEEMMKVITFKPLNCGGRGSLISLLYDLRNLRRDRVSVAGALNAQWPELVALFHSQRRYLRCPSPTLYRKQKELLCGTELCFLIRLMYDLWFGVECEAESTCMSCSPCTDGVPTLKEKMQRLLCSEAFMSLPFYVWRIGRTRQHALDEWEEYPRSEGYEIYMAFALIGCASIGCFNASFSEDLKDRIINFVQSFAEAQPHGAVKYLDLEHLFHLNSLDKDAHERLAVRVGDAVCKMARAPSIAAALGHDFMHITMDGLEASYDIVEIPREERRRAVISSLRWKPRVAATQLGEGETSVHNSSINESLGARVLLKIMPKIMPISVLDEIH